MGLSARQADSRSSCAEGPSARRYCTPRMPTRMATMPKPAIVCASRVRVPAGKPATDPILLAIATENRNGSSGMLPPFVSVRGSLKTMALVDVLEWLDRRRLRGELSVQRGSAARKLHIVGGDVTGVSSSQPTEHLGPALVEAGLLDDSQIHAAAERPRGQPLGRFLVESGLLPEEKIRPRLETQIRESACDVLSWPDGSFLFDPDGPHEWTFEVRAAVPLRECLREAAARALRWPVLREQVGSEDARFYCVDPAAAEGEGNEAAVLRELTRGPTVRELITLHRTFAYPM